MRMLPLALLAFLATISFSRPCPAGFIPALEPVWEQSGEESCDLARTVAGKGAALFAKDKAAGTKLLLKAGGLCGTDSRFVYNVAVAYYLQGLVADARPLLQRAAESKGARPAWRNNYASLLLELNENRSEALSHAEAAAKGDEGNPAVQETLAKARLAAGERLDAVQGLHDALASHPNDKTLKTAYRGALDEYLAFYWSEVQAGHQKSGLAGFKAADFEPEALRAQALALCEFGRCEEALASAKAAQKRFKDNALLARTTAEVAELAARELYLDFQAGKGASAVQRAKKLSAAYPVKPLTQAYDRLLEALLSDATTISIPAPEAAQVGEMTADESDQEASASTADATAAADRKPRVDVESATATAGPKLEVASVVVYSADGGEVIKKGTQATITLTLKNSGDRDAGGVGVVVEADKNVVIREVKKSWKFWSGSPVVSEPGKASSFALAPGKSAEVAFIVEVGEDFTGDELPVDVSLVSKDPQSTNKSRITLAYDGMQLLPELELTSVEVKSADGGHAIRKGTTSEVIVTVQNTGEGAANSVGVLIESADPNVVISQMKKWWQLWSDGSDTVIKNADTATKVTLLPGQSRKVSFTVDVKEAFNGAGELPLSVKLVTRNPRTSNEPPVKLAYEEAPSKATVGENKALPAEASLLGRISNIFTGAKKGADDGPVKVSVPAGFGSFTGKDHAVVIGIERYRGQLPSSEFSNNDARAMKNYLIALGFEERNIDTLTDDRATLADIRATVERKLKNRTKKHSRVFFYFSGHGAPDPSNGDAYLVPFDGDPNYIADTGYSLSQLYESLGRLPASEVTVVLDTCFSGTGGRSVLAKGVRPLVVKSKRAVVPANVAVLTSTNGAQISTVYQEGRHGLFTWFFLKAISEGRKDLDEIYAYLRPHVEDEAKRQNVEQSPSLDVHAKGGKKVFVLHH